MFKRRVQASRSVFYTPESVSKCLTQALKSRRLFLGPDGYLPQPRGGLKPRGRIRGYRASYGRLSWVLNAAASRLAVAEDLGLVKSLARVERVGKNVENLPHLRRRLSIQIFRIREGADGPVATEDEPGVGWVRT